MEVLRDGLHLTAGIADCGATPWNQSNVLKTLHFGGGLDCPRRKLEVVQAGWIVIVM